jgi:hypothetical protein
MEMLVYFTAIRYDLWPIGTFGFHLVVVFGLGIMYQKKSGIPGIHPPNEKKNSTTIMFICTIKAKTKHENGK